MLTTIHVNPVKRRRHQVLATIGLVLASLCKESFILMIPAALLLNFYCELPSFKYKWKQTILGSKALNAVLSLVFIVEGLIVVFAVGTNKIGYAGADSGSFNLPKLFETFKNLASDSNSRMLVILGLIYTGVIIISYDLTRKWNTKSLMRVASAVVLFCAIVFPQVFLYTKSGIYERYMIPGVLGFAFLSALFWQEIISMIEHNWLRIVITLGSLAGVALLFYPYYKLAVLNANAFTAEGEATFTSLSEIAKFDEKSTVVIVADPVADFENSYSLNKYLTLMQHKSNIYLEPLLTVGYDSKFKAGLDKGFVDFVGQPTTAKLRSDVHVSAFFVFKDAEEKFLGEDVPFFAANQYTRHEFGDYIVYTK